MNRFILHTNAHQPWEIGPGFSLGEFGTNFNRHNTWWEQSRAWMDYCARSQFLLQQGQGVQDVLFFMGESTPNNGMNRPDIRNAGLDYDYIGLTNLLTLTVEDKMICSSVGRKYRMLLLPDNDYPSLTTLRKLKELADAGATIFGRKPSMSPSLDGYPQSDAEYQSLADELWGTGNAAGAKIRRATIAEAMKATGLEPDFQGGTGDERLRYTHRSTSGGEVYFISNQLKDYRRETCTFRVSGLVPELWNPQTGTMERVAVWNEADGKTSLTLDFTPEQAYFIVFRQPNSNDRHYITINEKIPDEDDAPITGLGIVKAEYGQQQVAGIKDVTDIVLRHVENGKVNLAASNNLAGDPCYGSVKEMRVSYFIGDKAHSIRVPENSNLILPQPGETGPLRIESAFYGYFPEGIQLVRTPKTVDVTAQVNALVAKGQSSFRASEVMPPLPDYVESLGEPKLHIIYNISGVPYDHTYTQDMTVDFRHKTERPAVVMDGTIPYWLTNKPGHVTLSTANGKSMTAKVTKVPQAITLDGSWDVHFNQKWGREWDTTLPQLISWSASEDEDMKYFGGTAVYTKTFTLPNQLIQKGTVLSLDLGQVYVIAEVLLNGKNLGILWNAPYCVDISKAARKGENKLEVRLTNQWVNRLIGDDRLPEDFEQKGKTLGGWPEWMQEPAKRQSGRTTFVAFKHWNQDDQLLPAGLVGPVVIKPYIKTKIK